MTVSSEFYDGFRVALQQCHHRDTRDICFAYLCHTWISIVRNGESPVKHSTYLCKVMSTSGQVSNDSVIVTAILLVRYVLPNGDTNHAWIIRFIQRIQKMFINVAVSALTIDVLLFYIYFLTFLIEGPFMTQSWIHENIIKWVLCHNGLRCLMDTIKYSIETKNFLGVYISKQFLSHVLTFMEVIETKPQLAQLHGLQPLWNLDYKTYNIVSGIDFIVLECEEWMMLVTFLYIGVTLVQKVDLVSVYINIVSLLDMALVKEFEISDRQKEMMMEIYCVSFFFHLTFDSLITTFMTEIILGRIM